MRATTLVWAAVTALVLGTVQIGSMALYGDLAQPPAFPALLPPSLGIALGRALGSPHAPAVLRTAYARALLHRGKIAAASAIVAGLPDGADSADVRGTLAEMAEDRPAALAAYARAGDFEQAQRLIDASVAAGRYAAAAALESGLVDALSGLGQAAVRARALWRLGQITQLRAVADVAQRDLLQRRSLDFYLAALAIAPNEETYLLAAGQQALTAGDNGAAKRFYLRALEAVPDSADARAGLLRAQP